MPFCHQCRYNLQLGIEKFCPSCGFNLKSSQISGNAKSIGITNTKGDVIGTDFKGSGIIAGKEIDYRVQGNVINLNINAGILSQEVIDNLQKVISLSAQIELPLFDKNIIQSGKDLRIKENESNKTQQQIKNVLDEVNKVEEESGRNIEQIKMGDMQISKDELYLKEIILKGNEQFYKQQYEEAIEYFDKALMINPDDALALYNKGAALYYLGNYEEAIEYFDKSLMINPDYLYALNNKGAALYYLGNYEEAIEYYDKALSINPSDATVLYNKGDSLDALGNYEEAIEYYDKALSINPSDATVLDSKQLALDKLKKSRQ